MNKTKINPKLVEELAKSIKTEKDLSELSRALLKMAVEKALSAELDNHLGYDKHAAEGHNSGNSRNGTSSKEIGTNMGEVEIITPRDRNSSFEPKLIQKHQTRFTEYDERILSLYARGMTTRDIADTFKEMYGADVSHSLISRVTEAVAQEVEIWQSRPLDAVYPILYLDCIVIKCKQDGRVINKSVYLALAVNIEGNKELLGMWIAETEGAKFWLSVLTELKNRGLEDILICCVDGLSGFPEAINTAYPNTKIQLCIVHMVRNSLKYVSHKDMKSVASDLKKIYLASTVSSAENALKLFSEKWDKKYPMVSKKWFNHWDNLVTMFEYPNEIRKVIYTTNAIESVNSVIRKAIRNRKIFPNDMSALKMIYLAIDKASRKWTMPVRNWRSAANHFAIAFDGRFPE